jgi:hypothetical protein
MMRSGRELSESTPPSPLPMTGSCFSRSSVKPALDIVKALKAEDGFVCSAGEMIGEVDEIGKSGDRRASDPCA